LVSYAAPKRIMATLCVIGCLIRVPIDERPIVGCMLQAAHFMLDLKQDLAGIQIDNVGKGPLFADLSHEAAIFQKTMWSGVICDIDLEMMAIEGRYRRIRLVKQ